MFLRQLFDPETSTYTYLVADPSTRQAALIDPVRDHIDRDLALIAELDFTLTYVLETHVHADHITAAGALRARTGATTVAHTNGAACIDRHVRHGDRIALGTVSIEVLATPGHTDDSLSYRIGAHVFTGDALLVRGTGRADFQNGDPAQLFDSITRVLFALPNDTTVWPGHDYRGRTCSTIAEERAYNPRIAHKSLAEFTDIMNNLGLPAPKKLAESVPANRQCGDAR